MMCCLRFVISSMRATNRWTDLEVQRQRTASRGQITYRPYCLKRELRHDPTLTHLRALFDAKQRVHDEETNERRQREQKLPMPKAQEGDVAGPAV